MSLSSRPPATARMVALLPRLPSRKPCNWVAVGIPPIARPCAALSGRRALGGGPVAGDAGRYAGRLRRAALEELAAAFALPRVGQVCSPALMRWAANRAETLTTSAALSSSPRPLVAGLRRRWS